MIHAIPDAVLTKHTAVVGMTGSGKTSTSKLLIEQVAGSGSRVCILDSIKSDWWGLTSDKAGTGPGLPFQILGGPHGHVPLHAGAGAAIGELVAAGKLPLSIIDMADFGPGGLQHFFNEFAPVLMKKMRGVLYLVIEEAHEFCPKEKSGVTGENMAVYYAKKLATAGRSKGVRLVVATQRVQALHNAVLSSCETVIVHRMTYPADQEPVTKWLKGSVKDRDVRLQIEESMPELADGEGWICSGSAKILQRIQFPRIQTFDNSATPEDDSHRTAVVTAKVDVARLRAIIGDAVQDAESNDVFALKKRIRELEARPLTQISDPVVEQLALAAAREDGERVGFDKGANHGYRCGWDEHTKSVHAALVSIPASPPTIGARTENPERRVETHRPAVASQGSRTGTALAVTRARQIDVRAPSSNGSADLQPVQQRVLNALAELEQMGAARPDRELVAFMSGYSHLNSKGFTNAIGALRSGGLIEAARRDGTVALTNEGRAAARPPAVPRTPEELQERVIAMLGGATARILKPLLDKYPGALPREEVAHAAGYSHLSSKGFTNSIGRLRSLGFIDYPDRGTIVAKPVLFLETACASP